MENQNKPGFDDLPYEIIQNIFSRLPITSLIRLGFVSRSWRTIAHDPHLANLHLSQTKKNNSGLTLISHNDHPNQDQLHFAELSGQEDEDECVVRNFQTPFSIPKFNVIGSCNGLLCLLNNNSIYIYNPFTRKYKELPECKSYEEHSVFFGFGFHPITNEYKIVKIVYGTKSEVQVHCISDNTWRSIGEAPYGIQQQCSESVLLNGRLHWVWVSGDGYETNMVLNIISFDLGIEQFYEVPKPEIVATRRCFFQLGVLAGCLSMSVCRAINRELDIWVMKEYGNKDSWIKKYEVGSCYTSFPRRMRFQVNLRTRIVRVLGLMNNGKILLDYGQGELVLYNTDGSKFKKLEFKGTLKLFQPVLHYGTLNWIDNPLEM